MSSTKPYQATKDFECPQAASLYRWGTAIFWLILLFAAVILLALIFSSAEGSFVRAFFSMLPFLIYLLPFMFLARLAFRSFAIVVESHYRNIVK